MFIRVTAEDRNGNIGTETLNIAFIARVKSHNGKTIIAQHGMDYDVWATESKEDVDDMIAEAGGNIVSR